MRANAMIVDGKMYIERNAIFWFNCFLIFIGGFGIAWGIK